MPRFLQLLTPRYLRMAKLVSAIPSHRSTTKTIPRYERKLLRKLEHEAALINLTATLSVPLPSNTKLRRFYRWYPGSVRKVAWKPPDHLTRPYLEHDATRLVNYTPTEQATKTIKEMKYEERLLQRWQLYPGGSILDFDHHHVVMPWLLSVFG